MTTRNVNTSGPAAGTLMTRHKDEFAELYQKFPYPNEFYMVEIANTMGENVQKCKRYAICGIIEKRGYDNPTTKRRLWRFAPWVEGWLRFYGAI